MRSGWEEEAMCSVCIELYTNPVLLDCGHNVCRGCAESLRDFDANAAPLSGAASTDAGAGMLKLTPPSLRCPLCRAETMLPNGVEGLKCNITLRNVVQSLCEEKAQRQHLTCGNCEAADAAFDCEDCNFQLCHECREGQHARGGYKRHKIHPLGTLLRLKPKQCETHHKDLDLYSPSRNELLCVYCLQLGSGGHDASKIIPLSDAAAEAISEVREALSRLDSRIQGISASREKAETQEGAAQGGGGAPAAGVPQGGGASAMAAARQVVKERFAAAAAALQAKEAALLSHLEVFETRQAKAGEEAQRRSASLVAHMRDVSKRFADAVGSSHHADLVRAKSMMLERVARLTETELPEAPMLDAPVMDFEAPLEAALQCIGRVSISPPDQRSARAARHSGGGARDLLWAPSSSKTGVFGDDAGDLALTAGVGTTKAKGAAPPASDLALGKKRKHGSGGGASEAPPVKKASGSISTSKLILRI